LHGGQGLELRAKLALSWKKRRKKLRVEGNRRKAHRGERRRNHNRGSTVKTKYVNLSLIRGETKK